MSITVTPAPYEYKGVIYRCEVSKNYRRATGIPVDDLVVPMNNNNTAVDGSNTNNNYRSSYSSYRNSSNTSLNSSYDRDNYNYNTNNTNSYSMYGTSPGNGSSKSNMSPKQYYSYQYQSYRGFPTSNANYGITGHASHDSFLYNNNSPNSSNTTNNTTMTSPLPYHQKPLRKSYSTTNTSMMNTPTILIICLYMI